MSSVDTQLVMAIAAVGEPVVEPRYELVGVDGLRGAWAIQTSLVDGERRISGVSLQLPDELQRLAVLPTLDYLPDEIQRFEQFERRGFLHQIEEAEQ